MRDPAHLRLGLLELYDIDMAAIPVETIDPCGPAMAEALDTGAIDVGRLCSTQPEIVTYNLVVLEDDQGLVGANNMAPVLTQELADAGGDLLASTLNAISAELTQEDLTDMYYAVAVDGQDRPAWRRPGWRTKASSKRGRPRTVVAGRAAGHLYAPTDEHDRPMSEQLELADWRRQVSVMYAELRADPDPGVDRAAAFRAARDRLFASHPQSPIPAAEREGFSGLAYWAHDPAWRVTGTFEADVAAPASEVPVSAGEPFAFNRIGWAVFTRGERTAAGVFWLAG